MQSEGAFPRKKIATKAKHLILQEYVKAWGGIIIRCAAGSRAMARSRSLQLAYLDTCSGAGIYEGEETVDGLDRLGSPIIALRQITALLELGREQGVDVSAKAMFINTSEAEVRLLRSHVTEQGFKGIDTVFRVGEFALLAEEAQQFLQGAFGLVLIDPYGPSAIPLSAVLPLVSQERNDCLVHFPTNGLKRWAGSARKLEGDRTPEERKVVARGDEFFGDTEWVEIARREPFGQKCEDMLVAHYRAKIMDCRVRTLAVPLLFCDQNQTKYHLLFTSANVAGLARMKDVFQKGDLYQHLLRHRRAIERERASKGLFLFEPEMHFAHLSKVDQAQLAQHVLGVLRNRGATEFQEILAACLDLPNVLESHVRKCLTALRRDGRVAYHGTKPKYHDCIRAISPE